MSYATDLTPKSCTEPTRDEPMIQGAGGGFGFQISDMELLDRFLILGHEGGTYYANQRDLTHQVVDCIDRLVKDHPHDMVARIVEISTTGRAPKNNPAIFALAYIVSKHKGTIASFEALENLNKVCRIPTHLFMFLTFCKQMNRGWGTAFKRAVGEFYNKAPMHLAHLVTKYQNREGWSHRDVLRKCHYKTDDNDVNSVLEYVTQRDQWLGKGRVFNDSAKFLAAVEECKNPGCTDKRRIELILEFKLVREHMPTSSLNNPDIWAALLQYMPTTAMVRNLAKMTSIGLISPLSDASSNIVMRLNNPDTIRRSRMHPVQMLIALKTYSQGRGVLGSLSWSPDQNIVSALDGAFYASFDYVEPTNKRFLLGIDVSGSMGFQGCVGTPLLKPREAAAAMAMVAMRTEPATYAFGFSDRFVDLGITASDSLQTVLQKTRGLPFRSTRTALAIEHAIDNDLHVDVFAVYTDNEVNAGQHPYIKLQEYREKTGINAKLAVFGMTVSDFSIANPSDPGMLDFVGFDSASPTLLADFAKS